MKANVHSTIKNLLSEKLLEIEDLMNADLFSYYGVLVDGLESDIVSLSEELSRDGKKRDRLVIILTTSGGSAFAVERYVNIFRHHYKVVDFVVPDYAYSAGTIFCMSGDNIYMDYASVLGPIDPQVQNKDGRWVAALGYLDKVNEAVEKSRNEQLTQAEYLMIKDLDLSELRSYEQAKELTTDLLMDWLVNYKFKNWSVHGSNEKLVGKPVTMDEKMQRAKDIAMALSDHSKWKSHGRPINSNALKQMGLRIENLSDNGQLHSLIRGYYELLSDYVKSSNLPIFVHTRKFI